MEKDIFDVFTFERINTCMMAHITLPLPIEFYDIEPNYDAICEMIKKAYLENEDMEEEEKELECIIALSDAFETRPSEVYKISLKDASLYNWEKFILDPDQTTIENDAKSYPEGRPWDDFARKQGYEPTNEVRDYVLWKISASTDTKSSTEANTNNKSAEKDGADENMKKSNQKTKRMETMSDIFGRYLDIVLKDGSMPFEDATLSFYADDRVVDGAYKPTDTDRNLKCVAIFRDEYKEDSDGKPIDGCVRMKYANYGSTHKMECVHWFNGEKHNWGGAKAFKEYFNSLIDGVPTETKNNDAPKTETKQTAPKAKTERKSTKTTKTETTNVTVWWDNNVDDDIYIISSVSGNATVKGYDISSNAIDYEDTQSIDTIESMLTENGFTKCDLTSPSAEVLSALKAAGVKFNFTSHVETTEDAPTAEETTPTEDAPTAEETQKAETEDAPAEMPTEEQNAPTEEMPTEEDAQTEEQNEPTAEMPTTEEPKDEIIDEHFDDICACVKANKPVLLFGPAGTGKTTLCAKVAERLGLKFFSSSSVDQPHELVGFTDAYSRYVETEFFRAFTQKALFDLDEVFNCSPQVLVKLNAAIAQRYFDFPGQERVYAHPDFRVIATDNTNGKGGNGQYVRESADASFLNRFVYKMYIDYDERVELEIANGDTELVEFIHDMRDAVRECQYSEVISYRQLDAIANAPWENLETTMRYVFGDSMTECGNHMDDMRMIANNLKHPYNKYAYVFRSLSIEYKKSNNKNTNEVAA